MNKKDITIIILIILLICSIFAIIYLMSKERNQDTLIKDGKEIERKWLINEKDIPYDLSKADKFEVEQSYISFDPEIRIRRINNGESYVLTIKSNMSADGLVRDEIEYYITEESYNLLLAKKEGNTIYKTRYQLYDNDLMREIDIFKGDLAGLAYMETEYKSEEEAKKEETHSWVVRDVTSEKKYKNQSLAKYGMPK